MPHLFIVSGNASANMDFFANYVSCSRDCFFSVRRMPRSFWLQAGVNNATASLLVCVLARPRNSFQYCPNTVEGRGYYHGYEER